MVSCETRPSKKHKLARFFHDFRRISTHIGDNAVVGGRFCKGKALYHFGNIPDLTLVLDCDVATACTTYFKILLELVFECYTFPTLINGQWYYTKEFFRSQGKTLEDAEEELGYPRGYSGISGLPEDICWQLLRKYAADGCTIQQVFFDWLGKVVPGPDDGLNSEM